MKNKRKKIVVIGGGTGSFVVLSGLKDYDVDLSAIVSMADDGGSTGILRDELGVLPPGDIRQCLVALSESSKSVLDLFNYRFDKGTLNGHNVGNIFLTALEKTTGSFSEAVREAEKILSIKGRVIPVTLDDVNLFVRTMKGRYIEGENKIDQTNLIKTGIKEIGLSPSAKINPEARKEILSADLIVIASGSLYTSLIPNFLVRGVPETIKKSKSKVLYVCNLVNKPGSTEGFSVGDYVNVLEKTDGSRFIDYVLINNKKPSGKVLGEYTKKGELLVELDNKTDKKYKVFKADLLDSKLAKLEKGDSISKRNLIRHNKKRLAKEIMKMIG